ncbi:hypothetical protein AJ80_05178 [Polytolypa hystricis UAMH7299]|uniref:Uncharacterized protein n=1 Tax=Polytolypa hystricis (strain UAMH7299) TaxID=1447883 RepID=A0A2B7Y645_POLH7|nr:hypothetical protein AJ80_05178 [Polytolypa hystricis UAMH7299]
MAPYTDANGPANHAAAYEIIPDLHSLSSDSKSSGTRQKSSRSLKWPMRMWKVIRGVFPKSWTSDSLELSKEGESEGSENYKSSERHDGDQLPYLPQVDRRELDPVPSTSSTTPAIRPHLLRRNAVQRITTPQRSAPNSVAGHRFRPAPIIPTPRSEIFEGTNRCLGTIAIAGAATSQRASPESLAQNGRAIRISETQRRGPRPGFGAEIRNPQRGLLAPMEKGG